MKKIFTLFLCTTAMACLKAQNPVLLKDIRPGTAGSMGATGKVTEIVPTRQGYTFFNADDDGDGLAGLWRTDGTSAGTVKVNLTYPGYITYGASMITPLGANSVVFAGDNSAGYGEVWVSDGTQANTIALESYKPDSPAISAPPVMGMASTGNYVVYAVMTSNNHIQVKATNGSVAGTRVVKDFGGGKKNSMVAEMKALNGMVYFDYFDADGDGNDILLATDGVGTYRIGGTYSIPGQTQQYALASSFMPATNNPGIAGNDVYFFGYGFTDNHFKLFRVNNAGVLFTISAVKDFPGRTSTGSYAAINGTLYFTIDDKLHGTELWKTDGTEAGTVLAADINVGAGSSNPRNLVVMNNTLYFTATVDINLDGQATETGIFSYDGTTAHLMAEVSPNSSDVSNIGVCSNNTLLFSLNADKGSEPWIGSGTGINAPLADINPGANGSAPTLFTPVGDAVYFVADNGANGKELMKYTVESKVWDGIFSNKWNEADNWIPSGVPSATDNVLVGGLLENPDGDALFINDLIVNGEINSPSLFFINGNFYNSGKVTVNQLITGNTDGHLLHTFGGAGTFTGDIVPQNKSTLSLATNFTVNGELRFQSGQGNVNLNDYNLLVNSVSRQTTDAHVTTNGLGMLVLSNSGTTPLFFPVGSTNTSYTPATIINKGTADRFGVRVTDSTHRNGDNGATATSSVVNKTWFVKEGKNGGSDVDLTVQWNAADELPGFNRNNVYLNHYINSAWDAGTAAPATGSGPYTITRKSITSFSPFAVSSSATVLPIGLTNFEVTAKGNDALLLWTTASEKNTSHFNIQRSTDGVNFTLAGVKTAAGNSNTLTAYTYTDYLNGLTGAVYYRLQAVDKDGKTSFSQVRHIMVGDRADFSFSPNPAKNLLTVHGSNIKNIQLFNGEGKLVVEQAVNGGSVASQVNVSTLAKGVYLLVTTNYNGGKQTAKVVIE